MLEEKDMRPQKSQDLYQSEAKLRLREEQLKISKEWIKTGEVSIRKEIVTEEKTIRVPVTREELIIEKIVLDKDKSDEADREAEIIRIPICEEHIEIIKHPVVLEDVEVYKRQFHETMRVEEILKREELHVDTVGNPEVVDENIDKC